jgi:hypothetical protein
MVALAARYLLRCGRHDSQQKICIAQRDVGSWHEAYIQAGVPNSRYWRKADILTAKTKIRPGLGRSGFLFNQLSRLLFDDLDDLPRARIDQDGVIIYVGVSVALHVIFAGNFVIGHSLWR